MIIVREPILEPVEIRDLRPTQITVGIREVKEKRADLRKRASKQLAKFLGTHMIPVILGPSRRSYIIDHHHLSLALLGEGLTQVLVTVVADLSSLDRAAFWTYLDNRGWTHPYDEKGIRRDFSEIPKTVDKMKDDPYRSLAGELRRAGGFAKDTTPFSEFLWADFLRRRVKRRQIEGDFDAALKAAMKLARSQEAHYLPGWCGPLN
jgi:hypothetical protein